MLGAWGWGPKFGKMGGRGDLCFPTPLTPQTFVSQKYLTTPPIRPILPTMTDTLSIPQIRALSRIKFRNWLQDKRNPLGLTLAQIGEKAGVTRQRVSQVEKGVCLPSEAYSEQWASAYGVGELEFLMKGGVMPVWAIHLLAWDHFEAFKEFLSSLVESDAETTDEVGGLNNA